MRLLHTMLRVTDLERTIRFYTDIMGMRLLRQHDNPDYRYTLAFVGYEEESEGSVLEFTYNWDQHEYELGNAYGHIAIAVDNAKDTCQRIRSQGGNVIRDAGPVQGGTTIIAFVEDPDGYKIELIEKQ